MQSPILDHPDLEIYFFTPVTYSRSLADVVEKSFTSTEAALKGLKFAVKDRSTQIYVSPPPMMGLPYILYQHEPFHLHGWRGDSKFYRLIYSSPTATEYTLDLKRVLESYPKPWFAKIMEYLPTVYQEEKGGIFDFHKLPKRIDRIY